MIPGQKPYTMGQAAKLQEMMEAACEAEEVFDLDELERSADAHRMTEVRSAVSCLSREDCVRILESISIQCYDHEDIETLRTAVITNVEDGTLSPKDLLEEVQKGLDLGPRPE